MNTIPFKLSKVAIAAVLVIGATMACAQQTSETETVEELETVTITGVRPTEAGPQPGLLINREQIPGNLQSIGKKEIKESHSTSLGDLMNSKMQSINVNDYSGNPFQMDISYRGFTASPQVGSPQGLSVFFDGIRVNEPFGDVVNWDLIPMNAIERFDLFPGSNPLFGLNTLGGALSLRTKSGFSAPGADVQVLGGDFGRKQIQLSAGANNGVVAGFGALQWFDEDGWRDDSPSQVKQFFGRADWRGQWGTIGASTLLADNRLVGNGLIPIELYKQRPESVYTSPDETRNKLIQFAISGALDVSESFNITGQVYRRNSKRLGVNGDVYEGFDDFGDEDASRTTPFVSGGLPICRYLDANNDGRPDLIEVPNPEGGGGTVRVPRILNGPKDTNCGSLRYNGQLRNGRAFKDLQNGVLTGKGPGLVEGTPIGLITNTSIDQVTTGGALQLNWNLDDHKFMIGGSVDRSQSDYSSRQRLGLIDSGHRVYSDASNIDPFYLAAQSDIPINEFEGSSRTRSTYFSETWSPRKSLHLTFAGRYNHTRVANQLKSRVGVDLHEMQKFPGSIILCPSEDLASCPDTPHPTVRNDPSTNRTEQTSDEFVFKSFNPALGVNWLPTPALNLFANASKSTRTPSVIELGCAFDGTLIDLNAGRFKEDGTPFEPNLQPRSFAGPTCTLPSTLSGDPFLPQIKATSFEIGARGKFLRSWGWNISVYRVDLKDDIYFVGLSPERSYFDTVGKTRRQGFELGLDGKIGRNDISVNYGFTDATFQSRFFVLSPHNSSADFDGDSGRGGTSPTANDNNGFGTFKTTRVDPGARMPGIPLHNLNASWKFHWTEKFTTALAMIAHSKSFVRGNENNAHLPEGSDTEYSSSTGQVFPGGRPFTTSGSVPGYAIFNLDVSYKFGKGFTVFGQVNNLFDRKYFTAGRVGISPFSPSVNGAIGPSGWNYNSSEWQNTTFVGPGARRGIWLGLSYEWEPGR
jgi:iron complex outermembrane recepter protein